MSFRASFAQHLPPPQFLMMPSLGVDISDTSLKYIQFSEPKRGSRALLQWGEIEIPSGVLDRGQVNDPAKLAAVLKECKAKTGATFIRVSLPEERAYLFETEIKRSMPVKEIRSFLEFRLEENVPIPARDAFFDYDILEGETTDKTLRVVVAAYSRETILHYFDACEEAGFVPLSFEVEAQAMVRAVMPADARGAHMLVDFGKTRTGVGIVLDGVLMYTSTIDFGGNQLSEVLRKVHGDISEGELTLIKNTQGLIKGVHDTRSYDALISTVSVIKDELASRIQYWHNGDYKPQSRRIASIILCGGSSNLKGLPEYFTESLGIKTVRGNVWQNAFLYNDYIPPITARYSYGYATAVGLALKSSL